MSNISLIDGHIDNAEHCVCCGAVIPEGRQVCIICGLKTNYKQSTAVDVAEVKHGKWDVNRNCSVCGVYKFEGLDADVWADWGIDYCPHCGAKMDGKDEE